jgi:hypothetical protein
MAKHDGRLRLFLLRRAADGNGPPVLGDIEREAGSKVTDHHNNTGEV